MPETLIPIVAIIGGAEGAEDVAIGAIIGAPFLLATIAMALVGHLGAGLPRPARAGHRADAPTPRRSTATSSSSSSSSPPGSRSASALPEALRSPARGRLRRSPTASTCASTLRGGGEVQEAETIGPLYMDRTPGDDPPTATIVAPVRRRPRRRSSAAPTCSSRSCSPSPSRSGSSRWCSRWCWRRWRPSCPRRRTASSGSARARTASRSGNITGAMVFQSTIPIAVGLLLTEWDLDRFAVVSGVLGLAGGVDRLLGAAPARPLRGCCRSRPGRCCSRPSSPTCGEPRRLELGEGAEDDVVVGLGRRPSGRPSATLPSAPMMNVARCTPQYLLPYIDFSIQVPNASATEWSASASSVKPSEYLSAKLGDRPRPGRARSRSRARPARA